MSNPQPFTTTNTCKRCFNFNSIWHLEVMRQEIGGSRLLPPLLSFLFPLSLPCAGVLLAGPMPGPCIRLSGVGTFCSIGGWQEWWGWVAGWLGGPMQLGLCFSALVVLAGVLCGSFCSTSAPAGSFQSLCCYGGSGMSHLFSVRPWLMSCGLW